MEVIEKAVIYFKFQESRGFFSDLIILHLLHTQHSRNTTFKLYDIYFTSFAYYRHNSNMAERKPQKQRQMLWTNRHDILLCREVLVVRPYQYQKWSKEGSAAWAQIVETLEMHDGFYISQKSSKDHLALLIAKRN